jgi:hypothetical protein
MDAIMSGNTRPTTFSRKTLIALAGTTLLLGACASHKTPSLPSWGGGSTVPPVVQQNNTYVPPEQAAAAYAPTQFTGRTTFTEGCSGGFSVRDTRTNREISSGRAYNSGRGLIVLDSAGRQVRALSTGANNTSVLFLPDCNCRGGSQSSAVSPNQVFAARAPTGAACSAS